MLREITSGIAAAALMLTTAAAQDDAPNPKTAYLTEAEAGTDFGIQGEYVGTLATENGEARFGIQIVADGNGRFRYAAYPGGLPGDGFNPSEEVRRGEGEMEGDEAVFSNEHATGRVRDGSMQIYSKDGVKLAELARTIRTSPTAGMKPPEGAVVLFDGSSAEAFHNGRMTDDGLLIQGVTSKQTFDSFELHLEFRTSFMPYARSQARSNSGCYLQGRYEVQILDSFGLAGKNNEAGGIYEISDPRINMCYPPLSWQTYDVEFHAARYENGEKVKNAWMTVKHNGVVVQDHVDLPRATRAAPVGEGPEPGPVYLQDHGDPVRFRNIWVRPLSK